MEDQVEDYSDRSWLQDRMSQIIPKISKLGVCFGLSAMKAQAILTHDSETFERRLKLINTIPLSNFAQEIERISNLRTERIKDVKQKIGMNRELDPEEKNELMKLPEIHKGLVALEQLIDTLILENKLSSSDKKSELESRTNSYLFNAFTQKKINEQVQFSDADRIKLDIPAFLVGIQLYQDFDLYKHLLEEFPEGITQDMILTSSLIASKQLELNGGFCKNAEFSCVYNLDELTQSFNLFNQVAQEQNIKKPLVLIIQSCDHAICVGYDPICAQWSITDAAKLPTRTTNDPQEIAKYVLEAHGTEYIGILSTDFFYNQKDQKEWESVISSWKNTDVWKKIHEVTHEKCSMHDSKENTWLSLAARKGNIDQVKKTMVFRTKDSQKEESVNATALYWAVVNKDLDMLQFLIEQGEDPNKKNQGSHLETPLLAAAYNSRYEEAKILVEAGADVNVLSMRFNDLTPLHFAVIKQNIKLTELLIKNKASNQPMRNGATPLYLAAQSNDKKTLQLLLQHTENLSQRCYSNAVSLQKIAKHYGKEMEMEGFIVQKLAAGGNDPLSIDEMINLNNMRINEPFIATTAKEIAAVLGFKGIVAEITLAEECILNQVPYQPISTPPQIPCNFFHLK